jgi:hypothetical protein
MKIKEFIAITEEGENIRIKGQFVLPNKSKKKKQFKSTFRGIALHNAKAGEEVIVRI